MKALRIIAVVLLVLHMAFIFCLSAQTATQSDKTSGSVIAFLAETFYPDFENLDEQEQEKIISDYQFIARKGAHFALFLVLGILAFLEFLTYKKIPYFWRIVISALFCLIYAVSDEYHQHFIEGRSGELRDVFIDFSGALIGVLIVALFARVNKRIYAAAKKPALQIADNVPELNKKQLKELNVELWEKLNTAETDIADLKSEIDAKNEKIARLEAYNSNQYIDENPSQAFKNLEQKVVAQVELPEAIQYGASVIGKTVIEAAKYCNELTKEDNSDYVKELVNLILGRTEVTKAEILRIVYSELEEAEKIDKTDNEFEKAVDYFESVMAQRK